MTNDYLILDSQNTSELIKELDSKKIQFKKLDEGGVVIDVKNPQEGHEIIKKIKSQLTEFKMIQPTLEEAYIELLDKENSINN